MNRKLFFLLNYFLLALLFCQTSYGQIESSTNTIRQDYIEKYTSLTVKEMKKSGIPASIIMAQALLESDNGESELALTANNHFGIKCHQTWTGNRFYYDDDQLDDCFRAYRNVFESYRDHSLFLMNRARYHFLFDLDPNDYRAWAKGLKMAGYATNPRYADMLIKIIDENELYRLDRRIPGFASRNSTVEAEEYTPEFPATIPSQVIHTRNRIKYVLAGQDDTVEELTREYRKLKWEIRKYNEIPRRGQFTPGQVVYLQPKRNKAARAYDFHYAKSGESWYAISQHYGVKLKKLYKMNLITPGTPIINGQMIFLRSKRPENKFGEFTEQN